MIESFLMNEFFLNFIYRNFAWMGCSLACAFLCCLCKGCLVGGFRILEIFSDCHQATTPQLCLCSKKHTSLVDGMTRKRAYICCVSFVYLVKGVVMNIPSTVHPVGMIIVYKLQYNSGILAF